MGRARRPEPLWTAPAGPVARPAKPLWLSQRPPWPEAQAAAGGLPRRPCRARQAPRAFKAASPVRPRALASTTAPHLCRSAPPASPPPRATATRPSRPPPIRRLCRSPGQTSITSSILPPRRTRSAVARRKLSTGAPPPLQVGLTTVVVRRQPVSGCFPSLPPSVSRPTRSLRSPLRFSLLTWASGSLGRRRHHPSGRRRPLFAPGKR
jgi:hypothetical protein